MCAVHCIQLSYIFPIILKKIVFVQMWSVGGEDTDTDNSACSA